MRGKRGGCRHRADRALASTPPNECPAVALPATEARSAVCHVRWLHENLTTAGGKSRAGSLGVKVCREIDVRPRLDRVSPYRGRWEERPPQSTASSKRGRWPPLGRLANASFRLDRAAGAGLAVFRGGGAGLGDEGAAFHGRGGGEGDIRHVAGQSFEREFFA